MYYFGINQQSRGYWHLWPSNIGSENGGFISGLSSNSWVFLADLNGTRREAREACENPRSRVCFLSSTWVLDRGFFGMALFYTFFRSWSWRHGYVTGKTYSDIMFPNFHDPLLMATKTNHQSMWGLTHLPLGSSKHPGSFPKQAALAPFNFVFCMLQVPDRCAISMNFALDGEEAFWRTRALESFWQDSIWNPQSITIHTQVVPAVSGQKRVQSHGFHGIYSSSDLWGQHLFFRTWW